MTSLIQTCIGCRRQYLPALAKQNHEAVIAFLNAKPRPYIQDAFPLATAEEREQLISGICSDACWTNLLGPEE